MKHNNFQELLLENAHDDKQNYFSFSGGKLQILGDD